MNGIFRLAEHANTRFGLPVGGANVSENYVPVCAECSVDRLPALRSETVFRLDPIGFLLGDPDKAAGYIDQQYGEAPFLAIIVGEYGVGKTELMSQVALRIRQSRTDAHAPWALPIRLANCHRHTLARKLSSRPLEASEMMSFLLTDLLESGEPSFDDSFNNNLLNAVREGQFILLLDGLDELVFDSAAHRNFFKSLIDLIAPSHLEPGQGRVVVTMRYEYFTTFDDPDAKTPRLAEGIPVKDGKRVLNIYFLRVNLFNVQNVFSYLMGRLQRGRPDEGLASATKVLARLESMPKLLEILQRPLLLRIFTELLNDDSRKPVEFECLADPWKLIKTYVDRTLGDQVIQSQQNEIGGLKWNVSAFPGKCLDLYRRGNDTFDIDKDLSGLVQITDPAPLGEPMGLIHKCPIFQRANDKQLRFSHRAFFEYFAVKGLVDELRLLSQSGDGETSAFDELVLNVDMRKFLCAAIEEDAEAGRGQNWHDETRRSYGLKESSPWWGDDETKAKLEGIRCDLLDYMTDPQSNKAKGEHGLRKFLKDHNPDWHPGYLRFNYEAVAVFLRQERWNETFKALRKKFEKIICAQFATVSKKFQLNVPWAGPWTRRDVELLFERMVVIGIRLRLDWICDADRLELERLVNCLSEILIRERVLTALVDGRFLDETVIDRFGCP